MTTKLFKSMNLIRRGGGANLNLFRYAAILLVLVLGAGEMSAESYYNYYAYYAKVDAKTATESTGRGMVYVSTSSASTSSATSESSTATGQDPTSSYSSAPTTGGAVTFYLYAKAVDGYKFDGWSTSSTRPDVFESTSDSWQTTFSAGFGTSTSTSGNKGQTNNYTADGSKSTKYYSVTATHNVYAYFSELIHDFNVTFAEPSHGSITVNGTSPSSWPYVVNTTTGSLSCAMTATPASGYVFFGYYTLNSDGSKNYLSKTAGSTLGFNSAETVYAEFIPNNWAIFQYGANTYYDLNEANAKAVAANGGNIIVIKNGTILAGNYTISNGVTLLVPLNADNIVHTTPSTVTSGTPSRSVYRTLTLVNGTNITLNGSICVDAIMCLTMGYNGSAMNGYGLIDMKAGSTITMKSGSNFYVWGFVIGDGSIVAESGSTIHEAFQFKHRGGNALSSIASSNASKKVFPINQYYIQNIEAPITFKKGATEKVYTGVHNVNEAISIDFIGSSGLFNMTGSNAYLIKKYDVSKDRQNYTLYGDATIGSIKFGMSGFSKESKDFVLPITNNMTLNVESGTTTIQYETAILPDVELNIASTAKISTSNNCYVYDLLNWKGAYAYANDYSAAEKAQIAPVVYRHGGLQYNRKNYKLRDAAINVNGTLEGKIYTTEGGANITSSLGTGKVKLTAKLSSTTTYQAGQDGTTGKFDAYTVESAQLHNNETLFPSPYNYTATAGSAANTTFEYHNGHWGWATIWKDADGTTVLHRELGQNQPSDHYTYTNPPSGYDFDGWTTTADNTNKETVHTANIHASTPQYTITWKNMDGSLFETPNNPTLIEYDAKPDPPIENPTYSDNTHQLYVFTKWKAASDGHEYTTADLPNVTADETYTAQYDIVSELVVEGEQSISTETVVSTALLKVSGKLTVGAKLKTVDLILEATPSSSGELVLVGKSNVVAENAYFEFSQPGGFKARTWYAVAVPWQVEANGGISAKKGDGDFASLQLGSKIDLIYYRGDIRAASGPINECWQYVEDDPSDLRIMQQGRAYMFCLYTPADIVRFARKSDPVKTTPSVKIYNSTTGKDNDANWNGIANPATYHAYINAYADEYQGTENAGQVYDADNKSYKVINLSTTQLLVGQPVFVQATTDSEIQVYANKPTSAPRRAKAQSTRLIRYEIQLVANDSEKADRIIVRMDEDKEKDEYVVGKDLIKMGLSSLVPQIYINRYGSAMCINTAKPIHDKAEYPLGIFAPEAGEYDIFVAEASNEDVNIYLTYNGKAIWNLAYGPYTIALDKGTTNSYGLRLSASAPQVTTGIEEAVVDAQGETRKVLINNHVFIIRGNNVYGIDGQLIK